jgi:hypothetical protein
MVWLPITTFQELVNLGKPCLRDQICVYTFLEVDFETTDGREQQKVGMLQTKNMHIQFTRSEFCYEQSDNLAFSVAFTSPVKISPSVRPHEITSERINRF